MIVNEVLCYILYHVNSGTPDNIIRIITHFCNIDELIEAKKVLYYGRLAASTWGDTKTAGQLMDVVLQYQHMHKISVKL